MRVQRGVSASLACVFAAFERSVATVIEPVGGEPGPAGTPRGNAYNKS